MLARQIVFHAVGQFRGDLKMGEFIDWMARARELPVREALLDDTVLGRRLHETNHTTGARAHRQDLTQVVRASLDRRRAADAQL
jgi:hypothetical protein